MHRLTEAEWRRRVVAIARTNLWLVTGTAPRDADAGFPDLTLVHPTGVLAFAELKTDRGTLRPEQRAVHAALGRAGATVHVWRPRDEATVRTILEGTDTDDAPRARRLTNLNDLLEAVADHHGVTVDDLRSPSRHQHHVTPRQAFMRAAREAGYSYPAIGAAINRSHTTVLKACASPAPANAA